jgi:SAM-dependent methyltransferase
MRTVDELITSINGLAAARKRATLDHPVTVSTPPPSVANTPSPDASLADTLLADAPPADTPLTDRNSSDPAASSLEPSSTEGPKTEPVTSQETIKSERANLESTPAPPNTQKKMRRLEDFEQLDNAAFIREAYHYLLNREPDAGGWSYYDPLQRGYLSRVEVLHAIACTPEAKRGGARVKGLTLRYYLIAPFRVRFVGYGLRILSGLIRLPRHVRAIYTTGRELSRVAGELAQSQQQIAELGVQLREVSAAQAERKGHDTRVQDHIAQHEGRIEDYQRKIEEHEMRLAAASAAVDQTVRAQNGLHQRLEVFTQHATAKLGRIGLTLDRRAEMNDTLKSDIRQLRLIADEHAKALGDYQKHLVSGVGISDEMSRNSNSLASIGDELNKIADQVSEANRRLDSFDHLGASVPSLQSRTLEVDLALAEFRRRLLALERRSSAVSRTTRRETKQMKEVTQEPASGSNFPVGDTAFDSFYADFESRFRGTRADIQQRQSVYLRYLKTDDDNLMKKPIFDIGCGRGEWLELLGKEGINAVGVDLNKYFIDENERHGLKVVHQDALAFLKSQPDNSARAISGFHIIEHLEFPTLLELLDETLRVVAPGGVAIFETPNPENLITAAHMFYMDPTHRHPIPPLLAAHLFSHRGFSDVQVLRLQSAEVPQDADFDSKFLHNLFFGPRDYGLIGRK